MPLKSINRLFPRIRLGAGGRVRLRLGKYRWTEDADEPLMRTENELEAIKQHSRMWAVKNGFKTWRELLDDPDKLDEYHAHMASVKVRL